MSCQFIASFLVAVALWCPVASADDGGLTFACAERNDLYRAVVKGGTRPPRFDTAAAAVEHAPAGSGVLLLADGYPAERLRIDAQTLERARAKRLRLFVEYPDAFPGVRFGAPRSAFWERAVIASDTWGAELPRLRILAAHGCTFLPVEDKVANPDLVIARVAGYDTAVYGLPADPVPLLFATAQGDLVAATKLSGFVTGRYAPFPDWLALWRHVLAKLHPQGRAPRLAGEPGVGPRFGREVQLPKDAEAQALKHYARWLGNSGLLVHPSHRQGLHDLLRSGAETTDPPAPDEPAGDGSLGILEGFASHVRSDGGQPRRIPLRADCHGEAAMVLALHAMLENDPRSRAVAANLLDFVYFHSGMHAGVRGDPNHPAFGLVAWGDVAPAWTVATYGDDNARALLGTVFAAACLKSDKWDEAVLKGLLANLRTTGRLGFRGDRIDIPQLEQNGWEHYHDAGPFNPALNFEAYPWAAFLWAYRHTGEREFLDKAKAAIGRTMEVYPRGWRWGDNMERARMLLPLAWLVRVEDTPEHRRWLMTVAGDLLKNQEPCGAIREQFGGDGKGGGHYVVPASNEAYGTTETPLIQRNGDPASDQLYTTGFALIGLHEAAAATGDAELKRGADRLAEFLVRFQVRSEAVPYLDGAWFRAFDDRRWDYWASSADMGWGAWCVETGWGPAWTAAALGLRAKNTSLWELTADSKIGARLPVVRQQMSFNKGGPSAP
jgi:hypothetical protein